MPLPILNNHVHLPDMGIPTSIPTSLFPDAELPAISEARVESVEAEEICECPVCGNTIEEGEDTAELYGEPYCLDCVGSCEGCGTIHLIGDLVTTADRRNPSALCAECRFECADCGETFSNNQQGGINDNEDRICESCNDNYYTCEGCNCVIHSDNAHSTDDGVYCESCYEQQEQQEQDSIIHEYGYKPSPEFYQANGEKRTPRTLCFGMEIEFDANANAGDKYDAIIRSGILESGVWYVKDDGSLRDGFECVSHPGTWDYWKSHNFGWTEKMISSGYRSYNTTTCGMHVHVSKSALSELDRLKLLEFFKRNAAFIKRLSRRKPGSLEQWAAIDNKPRADLIRKVKGEQYERYEAVNMVPCNTVEFRIFRGTADKGAIMRNLAFVVSLCHYVKTAGITEMYSTDYAKWVRDNGHTVLGKEHAKTLNAWIKQHCKGREEIVPVAC